MLQIYIKNNSPRKIWSHGKNSYALLYIDNLLCIIMFVKKCFPIISIALFTHARTLTRVKFFFLHIDNSKTGIIFNLLLSIKANTTSIEFEPGD